MSLPLKVKTESQLIQEKAKVWNAHNYKEAEIKAQLEMKLRCGANCLDCTGEMRKIRGHACRFEELYHSSEEMKQLRKEASK